MSENEQITKSVITKDMTIGDAVSAHPAIADVLLSYGLHCVGCHVNAFETLEQGAMGHGMSEEEVDEMILEANNYLAELEKGSDTITVTENAISKLKTLSAAENKSTWGLRVNVNAGGCSGYKYELDFEEKANEDDLVLDNGFPVFISPESLEHLKGARIDYVDGLQGSGFKVDNPNAKNMCGCGKSFS